MDKVKDFAAGLFVLALDFFLWGGAALSIHKAATENDHLVIVVNGALAAFLLVMAVTGTITAIVALGRWWRQT